MMGQQQGGMSMGPQRDPMHENLFPPEMILRHENDIGLTDDQKKAVREAVLNAQTQFTKLQWEMQDAHQALAKLVKEDKIDEAKSVEQLDKVLKAETEMKRLQLSLAIQLKNQLTSAQIKQLQELKPDKARGARMGGRQGQGQGPGPGPGQPAAPDQAPVPDRRQ
jgi:Spy/CpxP family protein refolding chaperone